MSLCHDKDSTWKFAVNDITEVIQNEHNVIICIHSYTIYTVTLESDVRHIIMCNKILCTSDELG